MIHLQEISDSLAENSFLLVAAVARCALQDGMKGERSAQDWLDTVAPDWRKRWEPPPASWEIDLDALETPPSICDRCQQPYERVTITQRYCAECRATVKREAQRQSYRRKVKTQATPPVVIPSSPSTSVSRKELV